MDIIETVRRHVARRHKITRQEMVDILLDIDMNLIENSTITGRTVEGALYVRGRVVTDASEERQAVARAWAQMCSHITCISVVDHGPEYGLGVRYDQPGSMHPLQHALLMFVPEELGDHEYDQIGQMRRKAARLLIVSGEELREPPEPVKVPEWIARLRRHPRVDGTWARIHDDGMLELRDPNDGQSNDAKNKSRYQYRVAKGGDIEKRYLPPESVGDEWRDIGVPEWEYSDTPPRDDLIYAWWEAQVL